MVILPLVRLSQDIQTSSLCENINGSCSFDRVVDGLDLYVYSGNETGQKYLPYPVSKQENVQHAILWVCILILSQSANVSEPTGNRVEAQRTLQDILPLIF